MLKSVQECKKTMQACTDLYFNQQRGSVASEQFTPNQQKAFKKFFSVAERLSAKLVYHVPIKKYSYDNIFWDVHNLTCRKHIMTACLFRANFFTEPASGQEFCVTGNRRRSEFFHRSSLQGPVLWNKKGQMCRIFSQKGQADGSSV